MSENKREYNRENTEERSYPYVASIRFSDAKKAYYFGTDLANLKDGDNAVVETIRGLEVGEVVGDVRKTEDVDIRVPLKPVIRKATQRDLDNRERNVELAKEAMEVCQSLVEKLGLDMNLISSEYTLDRSKAIFVYVADERVDFRELLKELASALRCRIELRQIGMRDKAKIVGGLGCCGLETCCSRFLSSFDVVSINMAKNQLLALNTQKLSGQCGKLMCCLKYEDENYRELRAGLPKINAQIQYQGKTYRMTSVNVLTGQAKIENREEALFLPLDEIFPNRKKKEEETEEKGNQE